MFAHLASSKWLRRILTGVLWVVIALIAFSSFASYFTFGTPRFFMMFLAPLVTIVAVGRWVIIHHDRLTRTAIRRIAGSVPSSAVTEDNSCGRAYLTSEASMPEVTSIVSTPSRIPVGRHFPAHSPATSSQC